jgi:hypothetical protein
VQPRGKRLVVVSHRVLGLQAKPTSRLAKLPQALEAIADQMTLQGELEFGFWALPTDSTLQCRLGVEEFEDIDGELLERGSWILSGTLGIADGVLSFEVDDFDKRDALGKPYVGDQLLSIKPKRIRVNDNPQELEPFVVISEDQRPQPTNTLLRAALAYVDHVQAFEERRAQAGSVKYTATENRWRCVACKTESAEQKDKCISCGKARGSSPYSSSRVRLTLVKGKTELRRGDQVVVQKGSEEYRGVTVDELRGTKVRHRHQHPRSQLPPARSPRLNQRQKRPLMTSAPKNDATGSLRTPGTNARRPTDPEREPYFRTMTTTAMTQRNKPKPPQIARPTMLPVLFARNHRAWSRQNSNLSNNASGARPSATKNAPVSNSNSASACGSVICHTIPPVRWSERRWC